MIAFYNTKNKKWVSGYDMETNKLRYYDGKYQDHIRIFNTISEEVTRIGWNIPKYVIAVEIPASKFKECLKKERKNDDSR